MRPETEEQWRKAILERRIQRLRRGGDVLLDDIVDNLIGLKNIANWMLRRPNWTPASKLKHASNEVRGMIRRTYRFEIRN